jgi:hypothetical protein
MTDWTWEIVKDPAPDPVVEAWLDYMSRLGKISDTWFFYIGPAVDTPATATRDKQP